MAPTISGISGTLTDGGSIVIPGSNFGTKGTPAPAKWDNFSGGINGNGIANGWTPGSNNSNTPKYSTTQKRTTYRTPNDLSIWCNFDGSTYNSTFYITNHPADIQQYYISFWMYTHKVSGTVGNFKPLRVYGTGGGNYLPPAFGFTRGTTQGGNENSETTWVYDIRNDSGYDNRSSSSFSAVNFDSWHRIEFYLYAGTQGLVTDITTDASYWFATDCITLVTRPPWYGGGNPTPMLIDGNRFNEPGIGHYNDYNTSTLSVFYSDAYIDTTQARVEIGNASTWATCTHREIQIPSAWAVGSITATVNRGSFGASDEVYLYVVDSNGVVNANGYPIQFGQTYGGSAIEESIPLITGVRITGSLRGAGIKMEVK